jgi:hypothetical protein
MYIQLNEVDNDLSMDEILLFSLSGIKKLEKIWLCINNFI